MRTRLVGDHALLVLVDGPTVARATRRLILDLAANGSAGLATPQDVVPAAHTVLVAGLPGPAAVDAWCLLLAEVSSEDAHPGSDASVARSVSIAVTYDGPDRDAVAEAWGCSEQAVVARIQEEEWRVAFCGFAPGFAYCVPSHPLPEVPRRDEPRARVPGGSVALAGEYCSVYPSDLPGGWQLVGRTSAVLFDPGRAEPALLAPGDQVRFRAES